MFTCIGGGGHGISQVEQKHDIEEIFRDSSIPTTNLRATMFMEEFWKVYTRLQILKVREFNLFGSKLQFPYLQNFAFYLVVLHYKRMGSFK